MNVAVIKTKAEQAIPELFEKVADTLPGGAKAAPARREAMSRFAAIGLPHRRIEEWKYTDLRTSLKDALAPATEAGLSAEALTAALGPLAAVAGDRIVFVNGIYSAVLSTKFDSSGLLNVAPLSEALASGLANLGAIGADEGQNAVLALNAAFVTDGAVISVADGAEIDTPLLIVNVRAGKTAQSTATRNIINVGTKAKATIIEMFVVAAGATANAQANSATEIKAGDGAEVVHVKCVSDAGEVSHLSNWLVGLGTGTVYRGFQFTSGTRVTRNGINVTYGGENAKLDMSGAFLARGSEHIDTTLVVDHAVPKCESRELFKGVLANHSRGIFQGKIIVRPDAQKTDGKQMAQALMLSPDAEFDSKPELEIYADDVVCGHGSTVAEIDEDLMFYCQSRGIPPGTARALLVQSFIGEALEKIEIETLRDALTSTTLDWLDETKA
ncbi:MAG: Fe-S cluster assembly protein SufD [Hyphomicrobiaceae bacterium]|nr:Fe-S cluster assembly protein SufD [Hyphomicrobiaceae bacterium]